MKCAATKREMIEKLQKQILSMQGFRESSVHLVSSGLGSIEPNMILLSKIVIPKKG
jgi:hypothetical protein